MKTLVIHNDKHIDNGIELSHAQAVKVSRLANVAAVVDLSETTNGLQVVYQDGVVRLYDPVNNEIIGAAQPHRGRNGYTS